MEELSFILIDGPTSNSGKGLKVVEEDSGSPCKKEKIEERS